VILLLLLNLKRNPAIGKDNDDRFLRIRCPQCLWQPGKHDTWVCDPGCGHVWNTFDTRGLCPGCQRQWQETSCHRCGRWSQHSEWYESAE
jgi:hypothetical protein